jgi:hypothetical protein
MLCQKGPFSRQKMNCKLRSMSKGQINQIIFFIIGFLLILFNKPFAEICRQSQMIFWKQDYEAGGIRILSVLLGILFFVLAGVYFFIQ